MEDEYEMPPPPTAVEIARRTITLHCTICAAHGVSKEDLREWLQDESLWEELTPRELAFFGSDQNSRKEVIWMTWMVEAHVALLWAIGKLGTLPDPISKCDTGPVVDAMPGLFTSTANFISSAVLRSREEIEEVETSVYDIRVEVHQALRRGKEVPGGYDKHVAFYRHYGLCWLRGDGGGEWDSVSPDI